jgi:hypothetical protein
MSMVKGLWNYAVKVAEIERAVAFYADALGAELRIRGEVLGCDYALLRLGDRRLILFEKAPYEDLIGATPPVGFLHDVSEVASTSRSRGYARRASSSSWSPG